MSGSFNNEKSISDQLKDIEARYFAQENPTQEKSITDQLLEIEQKYLEEAQSPLIPSQNLAKPERSFDVFGEQTSEEAPLTVDPSLTFQQDLSSVPPQPVPDPPALAGPGPGEVKPQAFFDPVNIVPDLKSEFEAQEALEVAQETPSFEEEKKEDLSLESLSENPKINLVLHSLRRLEGKSDSYSKEYEERMYDALSHYIIQESLFKNRPLDKEISKRKAENIEGFSAAVPSKKAKPIHTPQGVVLSKEDPFEFGIEGSLEFSPEEYQEYALQQLAMEQDLDFAKLNKYLVKARNFIDETSSWDPSIDTRYIDTQVRNIAVDALNMGTGLAALALGGTESALSSQQTGISGELLDPASKAYMNTNDIKEYHSLLKSGDILTSSEMQESLIKKEKPLTKLASLSRISIRGPRNEVKDSDVFVPKALPTDAADIIYFFPEWRMDSLPIIMENIESSAENMLIDVPVSTQSIFEPQGIGTTEEKANVILDMLEGAMFTEDPRAAMGKFAPLIKNVPLPVNGDTLGNRLGSTLSMAMDFLNEGSKTEAERYDFSDLGVIDSPPTPEEVSSIAKKSGAFSKVFVDEKGNSIPRSTVLTYNQDKVESFLNDYITKEFIDDVGRKLEKGVLGSTYYPKDASKEYKDFKKYAGAALLMGSYAESLPEFNKVKEEYASRLLDGFSAMPEDVLLSFIAIDVALRDITPEDNIYTKSQIDSAKEKLKDDFLFVALDATMISAILGNLGKAGIVGSRAAKEIPKAYSNRTRTSGRMSVAEASELMSSKKAQEIGYTGDAFNFLSDGSVLVGDPITRTIDILADFVDVTKNEIAKQKEKIIQASIRPTTREDFDAYTGNDTSAIGVVQKKEKSILDLQEKVQVLVKDIADENNKPDKNPAEIARKEKELQVATDELEVRQDFINDKFENLSSRPTKQEPGPPETLLRDSASNYRQTSSAYRREVESVKNHNDLLSKASKSEQKAAAKNSEDAFNRLVRNNLPDMDNWRSPENASKVISMLQSSNVIDPGIYRYFLSNTRDAIRVTDDLIATLISETKVSMYAQGGDAVKRTVSRMMSKEELAKMSNQSLEELITRERAVAIADDMATKGITNEFAYARLPFLTDEQIRYFVNQARSKATPSNKKKIIVEKNDDGVPIDPDLEVYGKRTEVDPRVNKPKGLKKSPFAGVFFGAKPGTKGFSLGDTVAGDTTKRWFFGDRAVNLAANKEYAYSFFEFMSKPLAFVNIPRTTQNFFSESLLYLNTAGKGESWVAQFLDNFVTPENRLGNALYYKLLSLGADKNIDRLQMERLLSKIPKSGDFIVNRKKAIEVLALQGDDVLDFAKINASDFDLIVQSMLTKDAPDILVNGEKVSLNNLLELQVNQTGKLKRDISKLEARLNNPNLKSGSPIWQRVKRKRDKIQAKIDAGDVYVSVDDLYGSLPEKRAKLKDLDKRLKENPPNRQSLLREREMLENEILDLSSVTPEEAIAGVTDLRWNPKKSFADMSPTEKTIYYAAKEVVTPIEQRIFNVGAQIMTAADTVILAQKNSNAPRNIVVRVNDNGSLTTIKVFENTTEGANVAFDYMTNLNSKAKTKDTNRLIVSEDPRLSSPKGSKKTQDVAESTPSQRYETINADEVVWGKSADGRGVPVIKRAMDVPATNLVPMLSRYLSIYVDSAAVGMAAKEIFEYSKTLSPGAMRQVQNSMARKMLFGFEGGVDMIKKYGSPSKALNAILDMSEADQARYLGRALLPQEKFYSNQAFGSVMTEPELISVTANSRFRVAETYKGLLTNLENYRMLNASRMEGGVLTKSQWDLLSSRQKNRFVPLSNVHARMPSWGAIDDLIQNKDAGIIGNYKMEKLFGDGQSLYISREHATYFSDMAGLVELSTRLEAKALSYYKQAKILAFSSGIMPIQMLSSIFMHGALFSKTPGALFNTWVFTNGPAIFEDVVRVKLGKKAKNPLVEQAMRKGTGTTGSYLEFSAESVNESLFMVNALSLGEDFIRNPSSGNALEKLVNRVHDVHINAPTTAAEFTKRFKVVFDENARRVKRDAPQRSMLESTALTGAGVVKGALATTQFSYSLFDDFLKTLYAVSLHTKGRVPMGRAAEEAIKVWFNYGDLSRNAQAMRYGIFSPGASPFVGYLGNAAYSFPGIFSDAPLRAAVAGHASMIHNQSAIETIRIFNDITEMRLAAGDPLVVPFTATDVDVGRLSSRYGPGKEGIEDLVKQGQAHGSLSRIDPSPGLAYGISMFFKDPDSPNMGKSFASGMVTSPALDVLREGYDFGTYLYEEAKVAFGGEADAGSSAAETEWAAEKSAKEAVIQRIEDKKGPMTEEEKRLVEDLNSYIGEITRNDFGHGFYSFLRSTVLPVQIADMWEMLPDTFSIAPDRDVLDPRPWLGYKYNIADMNSLQKANVVENSTVNRLETRLETLDSLNRSGNLSEEVIEENNRAILGIFDEMNRQANKPDKAKKLELNQLEAMGRVRAALFSLYMGGKFDIFLRERYRKISEQ